MAYLLYGVMKNPVRNGSPIVGVKGKEVSFVTGHGLCAAVSEMPAQEDAPPVPELLAYGKVIEELHRLQVVVPMRYGCFLDGIPEIQRILGERRLQYQALIEDLAGHVEMGIRILLPEGEAMSQPNMNAGANGRDYLAMRKAHYRMGAETSHHHQTLLDSCAKAFSGIYGKCRTEIAAKNGAVILSIYFLVPEFKVNLFRETFGRAMEKDIAKAMISGPWPPYNFVATDLAPPNAAMRSARDSGVSLD